MLPTHKARSCMHPRGPSPQNGLTRWRRPDRTGQGLAQQGPCSRHRENSMSDRSSQSAESGWCLNSSCRPPPPASSPHEAAGTQAGGRRRVSVVVVVVVVWTVASVRPWTVSSYPWPFQARCSLLPPLSTTARSSSWPLAFGLARVSRLQRCSPSFWGEGDRWFVVRVHSVVSQGCPTA